MSERDDGGPAFPAADRIDPAPQMGEGWSIKSEQHGMSLRDYFAAKAMHAALVGYFHPDTPVKANLSGLCISAYMVADAMLKARKA